jgi:GntR family transcriptional regulator
MTMQFSEHRSIYMQITDYICENILAGAMRPGERVPSVRDLAATIEVNPNTVQRSYTWLQDRGVLLNKRGVGYFIADEAHLTVKLMKREQFVREELPDVFRKMNLIGFSLEDIRIIYQRHQEQI